MPRIQPFIKWSGSKRLQAQKIASYFPKDIKVYYEPFLGSGIILGYLMPTKAICGDIYDPLVKLWKLIQQDPKVVIQDYTKKWNLLQKNDYKYYYKIRDSFNKNKSPLDLLFLSRTCVNGVIRFNTKGEFNNSLHHSRKGIDPQRLKKIIANWSLMIQNYKFSNADFRKSTKNATKNDFIYLDPPYFNNKSRYIESINYEEFLEFLKDLNKRKIRFALSYDGYRGDKNYVVDLPKSLYKRHYYLHSGNSAFKRLQEKKSESVYESLYLNY